MEKRNFFMLALFAMAVTGGAKSVDNQYPEETAAATPAATQQQTAATQQQRTTAQTPASFTLTNGKLGPVSIGKRYATLPKKQDGLYDSYKYTKEEAGNDMESWIEEWCHFYKGGKEIFRCAVDGGKLTSIVLLPGSEFIKTSEGFHVGYNARELYKKRPMQWETYFEGESFGTSGHYTYYILSDDVDNNETPNRVTDIKATAKLTKIVYM